MENKDKKYVAFGDNGQTLIKKGKDICTLMLRSDLAQMVFTKEEASKWFDNNEIYELVPVDFEEESECKSK